MRHGFTFSLGCCDLRTPCNDATLCDFAQIWDAMDVFAGKAVLTECLRDAGYCTASLDVLHWDPHLLKRKHEGRPLKCKTNPLDLTSPAGFA